MQTVDGHKDAAGKLIPASKTDVTLTFTIALVVIGFAAYFGGLWMNRSSPRIVGVTAGVLYGLGIFLARFSAHNLPLLYLTYGVLGGIGLGLGYIVPIATLVKWFPDKRGLITGIAVAGFGAGSAILSFVVPGLIKSRGVLGVFSILGVAYLILVAGSALFMQNPPEGYRPAGWQPSAARAGQSPPHHPQRSASTALRRAGGAELRRELHFRPSAADLAVVRLVGAAVPQRDPRRGHHLRRRGHGDGDYPLWHATCSHLERNRKGISWVI